MLLRDIETSYAGAGREPLEDLMKDLREAQRFVFTASASTPLFDVPPARIRPQSVREKIFAPFPKTWVEFVEPQTGLRMGFLWKSVGSEPQKATVWTVSTSFADKTNPRLGYQLRYPLPFQVDILGDKFSPVLETLLRISGSEHRSKEELTDASMIEISYFRPMVLLCFSMIASNGVSHTVEADLSKLNKSRSKRGMWPLMSYKEIRLTVDAERIAHASRGVATGSMPLHPVRAHLRLVASGKFVIVRAHMRGDPKNGIRHHHYTVQTSDDLAA